jgi:hypothetical protein
MSDSMAILEISIIDINQNKKQKSTTKIEANYYFYINIFWSEIS